jgi:hypothetical protein
MAEKTITSATLRFNLDTHEGKDELKMAINAWKYRLALDAVDTRLRSVVKHGASMISNDKEAQDGEVEMAEKLRDLIREELDGLEL